MKKVPTIPVLVGRRTRALREDAGRSQDELADAARLAGLDWTRASVASLETGRRGLSAEELLLLPLALALLDHRDHTLAELLDGAAKTTRPSGASVETAFLRSLVEGAGTGALDAEEHQLAADIGRAIRKVRGVAVSHMAAREAERHAAYALNEAPEEIVRASERLWGRGLTEERERRLAERAGEDASPRSLQAIRGHVTRELLTELWNTLEEDGNGS